MNEDKTCITCFIAFSDESIITSIRQIFLLNFISAMIKFFKHCVKWTICMFYITMIRNTNGQGMRGAMETAKVMNATGRDVGTPTTCGTVRVLSQSDVYVFRDQDVNSMSLGRLNRRSKRYKRSASGFDSEERFDMESGPRPLWETDIQPKPRGFQNRNRRPVLPGQRANQPVIPYTSVASKWRSSLHPKTRLARLFNFTHKAKKQEKPIPDTFAEHMEKQFGRKFNNERKYPGTPQLLPLRNPILEGAEPHSKPANKKDMLKNIKRVSNTDAKERRSRRRMMARRQMTTPTIKLISPVSDASPAPDHKHTATEGKLPLFIEHILEDNVRNDPVVSKKRPMPRPIPVRNPDNDILGSLGPDRLEQLRKLFNAGPYGGGGDGQSQDSMDRSPRYRQKRSLTNSEKLAGQMGRYQRQRSRRRGGEASKGQRCNWIFNSQCKKLIVQLDYIIDGVRDCSREYLKIKTGKSTELFCGAVTHGSNLIEGEGKVTIEHFRSSEAAPHNKIRFKGSVYCE